MFTEPGERAKAMGVFGFVAAGGGSIGVLLGGVLTDALSWHWVFLVNLPIGIAVFVLTVMLIPDSEGQTSGQRLDVAGAVTVTTAVILAVYADRQRQRGRLGLACRRSACSASRRCCSRRSS